MILQKPTQKSASVFQFKKRLRKMPVERFLRSGWINFIRGKGNVALKRIYGRHTRKLASTEKTGRKISQFLT